MLNQNVNLSSVVDAVKGASDKELALLAEISQKLDERLDTQPDKTDKDKTPQKEPKQPPVKVELVEPTKRKGEVELSLNIGNAAKDESLTQGVASIAKDFNPEEELQAKEKTPPTIVNVNAPKVQASSDNHTSKEVVREVTAKPDRSDKQGKPSKDKAEIKTKLKQPVVESNRTTIDASDNTLSIANDLTHSVEQSVTNALSSFEGYWTDASGKLRRADGKYASKSEKAAYKSAQEVAKERESDKGANGSAIGTLVSSLKNIAINQAKTAVHGSNSATEAAGVAAGGSFFYAAKEAYELGQDANKAFKETSKKLGEIKGKNSKLSQLLFGSKKPNLDNNGSIGTTNDNANSRSDHDAGGASDSVKNTEESRKNSSQNNQLSEVFASENSQATAVKATQSASELVGTDERQKLVTEGRTSSEKTQRASEAIATQNAKESRKNSSQNNQLSEVFASENSQKAAVKNTQSASELVGTDERQKLVTEGRTSSEKTQRASEAIATQNAKESRKNSSQNNQLSEVFASENSQKAAVKNTQSASELVGTDERQKLVTEGRTSSEKTQRASEAIATQNAKESRKNSSQNNQLSEVFASENSQKAAVKNTQSASELVGTDERQKLVTEGRTSSEKTQRASEAIATQNAKESRKNSSQNNQLSEVFASENSQKAAVKNTQSASELVGTDERQKLVTEGRTSSEKTQRASEAIATQNAKESRKNSSQNNQLSEVFASENSQKAAVKNTQSASELVGTDERQKLVTEGRTSSEKTQRASEAIATQNTEKSRKNSSQNNQLSEVFASENSQKAAVKNTQSASELVGSNDNHTTSKGIGKLGDAKAQSTQRNTIEILKESSAEREKQIDSLLKKVDELIDATKGLKQEDSLLGSLADMVDFPDRKRKKGSKAKGKAKTTSAGSPNSGNDKASTKAKDNVKPTSGDKLKDAGDAPNEERRKDSHKKKATSKGKVPSVISQASSSVKAGSASLGGSSSVFKGAAKLGAKGAARAIPLLAPALAVYDAVSGFTDTEKQKETFGLKDGEEATLGQKSAMALGNVLDMGGLVSGGAGLLGDALGAMGFDGAKEALTFDSGSMAKGIHSFFGGDEENGGGSFLENAFKATPIGMLYNGAKKLMGDDESKPDSKGEETKTETTASMTKEERKAKYEESKGNLAYKSDAMAYKYADSEQKHEANLNADPFMLTVDKVKAHAEKTGQTYDQSYAEMSKDYQSRQKERKIVAAEMGVDTSGNVDIGDGRVLKSPKKQADNLKVIDAEIDRRREVESMAKDGDFRNARFISPETDGFIKSLAGKEAEANGHEAITPPMAVNQESTLLSNERVSSIVAAKETESAKETRTETVKLDPETIVAIAKAQSGSQTGSPASATPQQVSPIKTSGAAKEKPTAVSTQSGAIPNNFSDLSLQRQAADLE